MKLQLLPRFRKLSWTQRWMFAGIGSSIPILWLLSLFLLHDPERSKAIDVYESLKPGMSELEVHEMLAFKCQHIQRYDLDLPVIRCDVGKRYVVMVIFDNGFMSAKSVQELQSANSPIPNYPVKILRLLGLSVGRLDRSWSKK